MKFPDFLRPNTENVIGNLPAFSFEGRCRVHKVWNWRLSKLGRMFDANRLVIFNGSGVIFAEEMQQIYLWGKLRQPHDDSNFLGDYIFHEPLMCYFLPGLLVDFHLGGVMVEKEKCGLLPPAVSSTRSP